MMQPRAFHSCHIATKHGHFIAASADALRTAKALLDAQCRPHQLMQAASRHAATDQSLAGVPVCTPQPRPAFTGE